MPQGTGILIILNHAPVSNRMRFISAAGLCWELVLHSPHLDLSVIQDNGLDSPGPWVTVADARYKDQILPTI